MDFQLNDEQKMLVELAARMGREEFAPKAARWDRNHEYPHENVAALRRAGLLGMTIPKKFGGTGRPLIDVVLAIEQIAQHCGVTARIVVETNMGALGCVMAYGTTGTKHWITGGGISKTNLIFARIVGRDGADQ